MKQTLASLSLAVCFALLLSAVLLSPDTVVGSMVVEGTPASDLQPPYPGPDPHSIPGRVRQRTMTVAEQVQPTTIIQYARACLSTFPPPCRASSSLPSKARSPD